MNKKEIRHYILNEKAKLLEDNKKQLDDAIYNNVINCNFFIKSKFIFTYVSFENEVYTHSIIKKALSQGKRICVPKIISKKSGMVACEIKSMQELVEGKYGILEPISDNNKIDSKDIDFALIPGLAFDKDGYRIGYGGGFYDRFLASADFYKMGLSYEFQFMNNVPKEDFDEKIDGMITEKGIKSF
ncbi:MAG: 5-formyltetrahydrofolate cyclo-ligase [Clostridium sp.]|nr:5-formyltetrahydrofolate cyclo-ligase [Clostridium sp.]